MTYNVGMPNDYMTLSALVAELTNTLAGGRINKINMPSDDEAFFEIRAHGKNHTLILCARKPVARLHLSSVRCSARVPSAFCMLLRKHLTGGVIRGFSLYNNDRIAVCDIVSRNELHDSMNYKLILEIGGSPNLILAKDDFTILDCTRRAFGENTRTLLPSAVYAPPPQNKPNLFEADKEALTDITTAKEIIERFVGISRESAAEIELLASKTTLPDIIQSLRAIYGTPLFSPCVLSKDNTPKSFYVFPYQTIKNGIFNQTDSLSAAMDTYYSQLSEGNGKESATRSLRQTLKKLKTKTEKKRADNDARLQNCTQKDNFLQLGELIKCNAHQLSQGQKSVTVYDFYNDKEITIALDPLLSPMKNAAAYFRKYAKLKGAEAYAVKEKAELNELAEYLLNIEESLDHSTTETEYAEIALELAALTGKRQTAPQKNAKKQKASEPMKLEVAGFTVYIGKNNTQNELITFKIASGRDLWLHAKGYHGSHGVIITGGKEVPQAVIAKVASFVAYMSKAGASPKAEVDYTRRSCVKRLGKPGLVTYTDYKTITVEPKKPSEEK